MPTTETGFRTQEDGNTVGNDSRGQVFLGYLSQSIIPCALIVFIAPFLILQFYSVPAVDDFCKASLSFNAVPEPSVLSITWKYYTQWSPRWFTTLLQSFLLSYFKIVSVYGWILFFVFLSNVAALWYFFRNVFRLTAASSLLVAGTFYAGYLASLTDPEQQVLWVTGAIEYNLSLSTLLVLMGLLCRSRNAIWYYTLVGVLSVILPAQHEIAGVFLFVLLGFGILVSKHWKLPARHWYVSAAFAAVSQAIVMRSPGNAIRAAHEHRHLWDLAHLPRWISHSFYHSMGWLSLPAILLAACCAVLLAKREADPQGGFRQLPAWLGLAAVCGMLIIFGEMATVETAMGIWVPSRTVSWFEFVFWLFLMCAVLTGIPELSRVKFSVATQTGVYLLFAVSLLGSANFRAAAEDVRGPAQAWHRLAAAQLRQQNGPVEFALPAPYPRLAMRQQVTSDSGCWVNRCLANYLHATTVVGKDSSEECPH